jgi:hypothetical protein
MTAPVMTADRFEHRKAHTHASSQPKPAERRLVSDNGIMRRYTLVVTTLNPWITTR